MSERDPSPKEVLIDVVIIVAGAALLVPPLSWLFSKVLGIALPNPPQTPERSPWFQP